MQTRVDKTCEWNRYCSFNGPFCSEHLLEIGTIRPVLVGRCYTCGTYVCNRCARKRVAVNFADISPRREVSELVCWFDGRLLGRGDDWVVVNGYAVLVPAGLVSRGAPSDLSESAKELLINALTLIHNHDYEDADEICRQLAVATPWSATALALRVATLERLGRREESWRSLRTLLRSDQAALSNAIGELVSLRGSVAGLEGCVDESLKLLVAVVTASQDAERLDRRWQDLVERNRWVIEELDRDPKFLKETRRVQTVGGAPPTSGRRKLFPRFQSISTRLFDKLSGRERREDEKTASVATRLASVISFLANELTQARDTGWSGSFSKPDRTDDVATTPHSSLDRFSKDMSDPHLELREAHPMPAIHAAARALIDPRYGRVAGEVSSPDSERAIIVMCSGGDLDGHRNTYFQVEEILIREPRVTVLLEGFDGWRSAEQTRVADRDRRMIEAIRMIEREGRSPAAVLWALGPGNALLFGIGGAELSVAEQELARQVNDCLASAGRIIDDGPDELKGDAIIAVLDAKLQSAATRLRGALAGMLKPAYQRYLEGGKLAPYLDVLFDLAARTGVALDPYPSLARFARAAAIESALDFRVVEQKRLELLDHLASLAAAPLTKEQNVKIDDWMRQASPRELELSSGGFASLVVPSEQGQSESAAIAEQLARLSDGPQWVLRLALLSLGTKQGLVSNAYYYERLIDLLECLTGAREFDGLLSQYIEYLVLAEQIDTNAMASEREGLEAQLRDLASTAAEYGVERLRRELQVFKWLLGTKRTQNSSLYLNAFYLNALYSDAGEEISMLEWFVDFIRLEAFSTASEPDQDSSMEPLVMIAYALVLRSALIVDRALSLMRESSAIALGQSRIMLERAMEIELPGKPIVVLMSRNSPEELLRLVGDSPPGSMILVSPHL